jgi:hypothetical protein
MNAFPVAGGELSTRAGAQNRMVSGDKVLLADASRAGYIEAM